MMPIQHLIRIRRVLLSALLVFILIPLTHAQSAGQPQLEEILQRLEDNLHHYEAQIPSFLADEHVVSKVAPSSQNQDAVTDSTFRLKRTVDSNNVPILAESRDIKAVNGRPVTADTLAGPTSISGAFTGGLALVSLNQQSCMKYTLDPFKPGRHGASYIVEFTKRINPESPLRCLLQEEGAGRVFIDPATLQITHLELTAPQHIIRHASFADSGDVTRAQLGKWVVSIDYSPIQLDGKSFWLPSTIASTMTSSAPVHPTVWSFQARYTNYHKLEVNSRIVP